TAACEGWRSLDESPPHALPYCELQAEQLPHEIPRRFRGHYRGLRPKHYAVEQRLLRTPGKQAVEQVRGPCIATHQVLVARVLRLYRPRHELGDFFRRLRPRYARRGAGGVRAARSVAAFGGL